MRICIDATSLLLRSAGVKNYVYHWMRSLKAELPGDEILAFPMLGEVGQLDHERSLLTFSQTLPRIALLHLCNIRNSPLINLVHGQSDIFHASSLIRNLPRRPKLTGTIYDMTALVMPEMHTQGNIQAERNFQDRVMRNAHGLIAISESSKADAVRLLGLNPAKITVIYPGIDERFSQALPLKRARPYVLFVGTIEPRKNIDVLLEAWSGLSASVREHYDLILAGPAGWASEGTLHRLKSGIPGVEYLGYVPEADLPSLTAGATVFVYTSLYEGFGFPLAQAMAAGVASVTSNISSMPELLGDAGILAEPKDPADVRSAIDKLLSSESLRTRLGRQARERSKAFTWKNSARKSADFFHSVCR